MVHIVLSMNCNAYFKDTNSNATKFKKWKIINNYTKNVFAMN